MRKIVESPIPVPGSSYASVVKLTVKPVSLTDATTQTDPVTILDSEGSNCKQLSELSNNQQTSATQTKQLEAAEKSNISFRDQGKQASKENPVLKKATLEMMRKDWQKQQQRERQMNNKPSSPNKTSTNTKDKPQKKPNKPNTSNREQKGSMRRVTRAKWSLLTLLITLAIVIKCLGHQFSRHLHSFQS